MTDDASSVAWILTIEMKPRGKHTISFDSKSDADAALDETLAHMNETAPERTVKIADRLAVRVADISSAGISEDRLRLSRLT